MKLSKTFGRVAATFLATAMLASMSAVSALAEDYTAVKGSTMKFDKYLVMDTDANVPTAAFIYQISAGDAVAATTNAPAIKAPTTTQVDAVTVTADGFTPADITYNDKQNGDTLTLADGKKYAVDEVTVNFSNVEFTTPGIYRFKVTESGAVDGVTNDTTSTRYIDVYVVNDTNGLKVEGYVFHKTTAVADNNGSFTEGEKESGFTNNYATDNVTLTKKVEGNLGDKSKDFAFTITITSANGGKKYSATHSDGTTIADASTVEKDNQNVATINVNLSNNETVTIKGLSAGDTYQISENSVTGYITKYATTTVDSSDAQGVTTDNATAELTTAQSKAVTFYNIASATVATGLVMDIAPYILLVVAAAAGCFVFLRKRRED